MSFKVVTFAPASSYVLLGKLAKAPAFSSTFTVKPFLTNLLTTAGTRATLKNNTFIQYIKRYVHKQNYYGNI